MNIHELKTWPVPYYALLKGKKTVEVRRNDRNFQVGDLLLLREWDPGPATYSGLSQLAQVTYIDTEPGLRKDFVALSIRAVRLEPPCQTNR